MDNQTQILEENGKVSKAHPRGRPKGLPKTGGRKKQPSREDVNKAAWDKVLSDNLFNIPNEAIKLFFDKNTSNTLKFSILQFLAQYTTPAIKPVESEASKTDDDSNANDYESDELLSLVSNK
jgi:hypothetical protein